MLATVQNNPLYNPSKPTYAEVVKKQSNPIIDIAVNKLHYLELEEEFSQSQSTLTAFFEDINPTTPSEEEISLIVTLQQSQLQSAQQELDLLSSKIQTEGNTAENEAQFEEKINQILKLQQELADFVKKNPNVKINNLFNDKISGIKRPEQEIMNSLEALSKDFAELGIELEEFKKLSDTVEHNPSEGISQAVMKENLEKFQAKLATTIEHLKKIETEVEDVRKERLDASKPNTETNSTANEKLFNNFTTIWCTAAAELQSSIAADRCRLEAESTYVSNKIAQLPLMNDLLKRMNAQTIQIQKDKYSKEKDFTELRAGKLYINSNTHVKEEKREEFIAFVNANKQAFESIFAETLECGKNVQEVLSKIYPLKKQDYAKASAANAELAKQYAKAQNDLMAANYNLNFEVSYIQAVAADPTMVYPYENTWSVAPNAEMMLTANLEKVLVPVIEEAKVFGPEVKPADAAIETETQTAVVISEEVETNDTVKEEMTAELQVDVKAEEVALTTA